MPRLPPAASPAHTPTPILPHALTLTVPRPGLGSAGRSIRVITNHFRCIIPSRIIHHYLVVIQPTERVLPARLNMEIVSRLQNLVAPRVFTPRAVYDGRSNMFAPEAFSFGGAATFQVTLSDPRPATEGRPPRVYAVTLTKVAQINTQVLARFLDGHQSNENVVLTAITALNVVRTSKYPFFFTPDDIRSIGAGIVLWRGYFQSVRPAPGRMLINVDMSTGTMYNAGPLFRLCLDFLDKTHAQSLYELNLSERDRVRLQRFIAGLRVVTTTNEARHPRVIKKLLATSGTSTSFTLRTGGTMTVAQYFQETYNRTLLHPNAVCVEVGTGAIIPLELCDVPPGQILKKSVPPHKVKDVLDFATKKPAERLGAIVHGLQVLSYGQSEYMRHFGMRVEENPMQIPARVLVPPTLKYGAGSAHATITPKAGSWNLIGQRLWRPAGIRAWMLIVYERERRFTMAAVEDVKRGLRLSCTQLGIMGFESEPLVRWENGQGVIADQLKAAGNELRARTGAPPTLVVCILPEGALDMYIAIKHFGDCMTGVATQCMKSSKCFRATPQYYASVCLKINVKLGGINTVPVERSVPFLSDPLNPCVVLGADVMHPAPGSDGRPSFTALVGSVDALAGKYVAATRVQAPRQEIIADLADMAQHVIALFCRYRQQFEKRTSNIAPTRIVLFRDGVSEGQFKAVLDQEVPQLKAACLALGIHPPPKLTVIVVGKRHHVRLFPLSGDGDKSGNCPAGTVVDSGIVHPAAHDFYLQAHGGLLGTSRPAHYSVLFDESGLSADAAQALAFALCHVHARCTRAVSIPAPVYYADLVCARARNHFAPSAGLDLSDDASDADAGTQLERFKQAFTPLHSRATTTMYFT